MIFTDRKGRLCFQKRLSVFLSTGGLLTEGGLHPGEDLHPEGGMDPGGLPTEWGSASWVGRWVLPTGGSAYREGGFAYRQRVLPTEEGPAQTPPY